MTDLLLIALCTGSVLWATRRGLSAGFPLAVALLVFLPGSLRIDLPGALPELTIHRIILGVLLWRWWSGPRLTGGADTMKLGLIFGLMLSSRLLSLVFSVTPAASFKEFLGFALETVLFYSICRAALSVPGTVAATGKSVVLSLVAVAGVAGVERYAHVSIPYEMFSQFYHCNNGVQSTYPHRILLGYAMAMGLPLALLLIGRSEGRRRLGWWAALAALVGACFLADSRGGWLGMAIAGTLCLFFGDGPTRRRCLLLLGAALLMLVLRDGVRETIASRFRDTYKTGSYKGTSYQYRWRLWHVASAEISHSPERLLFGYGGQSTESMDLSHYFRQMEGGMTSKTGYTSWDNHYASDLIEFGLYGFILIGGAYAAIVLQLARARLRADPDTRAMLGAALVAATVFLFARTNVFIFGEQPRYLFWIIIAVAAAACRRTAPADETTLCADSSLPDPVRP